MEEAAIAYDELSKPQFEAGVQFIDKLRVSLGDKVLDMGCATGRLTKYMADIVGPDGFVIGIDPNAERIKIAKTKYEGLSNLQFSVGNSAVGFPHDNEPYYDVHISTHVFHWVPHTEKTIYIQKAFQSLKSGGKLAIWCTEKLPDDVEVPGFDSLTGQGYRDLFQNIGLFKDVTVCKVMHAFRYEAFEDFKRCSEASTRHDTDEYQAFVKKFVTFENNGQVACTVPIISITASKA